MNSKRNWVQVQLDYNHPATNDPEMSLNKDAIHYRVFTAIDDISGWADNEEKALIRAKELIVQMEKTD